VRDLLFLCHRIPYPPDKGDKIRAWHIFRHLARRFRVHLGCLLDDPDDAARVAELRPLCADLACIRIDPHVQRLKALLRVRPGQPLTLGYFHDARLQRWVDATLARHAIRDIFVYSSAVAHYVMRAPALQDDNPKDDTIAQATARQDVVRVLDMVDVDSSKWSAYAPTAGWLARAVYAREGRTLLAFERRAAHAFTRSIFVNEAEWRHFVDLAPEARDRTGWIENGVDLVHFSPTLTFADPFPPIAAPPSGPRHDRDLLPLPLREGVGGRGCRQHRTDPSRPETPPPALGPLRGPSPEDAEKISPTPRLVFTGRMDYRPNIDAVTWFARAVLPKLRARVPDLRFAIVGSAPTPEVTELAALPGVIVTGRVPDTRPWLAHASIVLAPLLIARGTQNKVLEGMAMGRPVIATPEAFEGVQAMPERDILLASGVEQTIERIIDVLSGRYPDLGAAARRAVELRHDWSVTLAPLDALFPDDPVPARPAASPAAHPIPQRPIPNPPVPHPPEVAR
jgi:glycosyltransferase involved in cell wall biosynthesis